MSVQKIMVTAVDPDENWWYRVGGISAFVIGIGYIITIVLYVPIGAPPSGAEALLTYLARNTAVWWAILGLMVLTDFLLVPVALSLYLALKGINKNAMLVATACVGLFIVLDLAVLWTNKASLINLSSNYAAATNDAQRAVFIAAASFPSAVLQSIVVGVYSILTLSLGILIMGLVMLKGIFGKSTAYLSLAVGISGIIAVAGPFFASALSVATIINAVLATVWALLVGYKLYRLDQVFASKE